MRKTTIGALLVSGVLAGPAGAGENEAASCSLRVVNALPGDGGVDEKLAPLKARLQRAPFLPWKSFRLLSEERRVLKPTESAEYELPGGRKARLVYTEHASTPDGKHHVRGSFALQGDRSSSRTMFSLDEGGVLLIAGQTHAGGILIYALSCDTRG